MTGLAATPAARPSSLLPRLGLRFALGYAGIAAGLFLIYGFPWELFGARRDWLSGYLAAYAHLAGAVLHWFDATVVVTGARIDGRFSLEIARNCDAIEVNILFASAVLAFPTGILRRLVGLIGGLALLVLANVARICVLYFIGVHCPNWFALAHEEVLPLALVVSAALIFLRFARPQVDAVGS